MRFSHSALSTYQTCPRLYEHTYVKGITTRKRETWQTVGIAVHRFIEIFYGTKNVSDAIKAALRTFDEVDKSLLSAEEIHSLEVDKAMVEGICKAYPQFYKQDFDQYESFLTEQRFKFPIADKHVFSGDIDVLAKDGAGDLWIIETKTAAASTLNQDYFDRVRIDSQVHGYMWGAYHLFGSFPRGVVYNVIKKPAIRLKKGETKQAYQQRVFLEYSKFAEAKQYFQRHEIIIGKDTLDDWLSNTEHLIKEITRKFRKKTQVVWPMNTGACTARFGACRFLRACVDRTYSKLIYTKRDR